MAFRNRGSKAIDQVQIPININESQHHRFIVPKIQTEHMLGDQLKKNSEEGISPNTALIKGDHTHHADQNNFKLDP